MTEDTVARLEQQVAELTQQIAALSNGAHAPPPADPEAQRAATLAAFQALTGLHDLQTVTQRGRDPETARFTLHFAGDTTIRIGTIKVLWSQAELAKVLAVAIGRVPFAVKPNDWKAAIGALFADVVDVEETPDEAFEDTVREWLGRYADRATNGNSDHAEAAAARAPFIKSDDHGRPELYIAATELAKYIRREYSETVRLPELRQALADLGYRTAHVSFDRGRGATRRRSSASYYVGPPISTEAAE